MKRLAWALPTLGAAIAVVAIAENMESGLAKAFVLGLIVGFVNFVGWVEGKLD